MKKKIGISFTRTLFSNYWNWFTPHDLADDVELVELSFEKNNSEDIYCCDGFVLTGGIDIHPSYYGGAVSYPNKPDKFQIERDRFEETIYHHSQNYKLPLLAICRGMQLVNVLQNGKLIQDLGSENAGHKKDAVDKQHPISTSKGSLLEDVCDQVGGIVNSAHHQSVDPSAIGDNLAANAYSQDDKRIIEGLEFKDSTDRGFMLCVQWHPERMDSKETNPFSENIKARFLNEVRKTEFKKVTIVNPATEEVIVQVNEDLPSGLHSKFRALQASQSAWAAVSLKDRTEIIRNFSSLLDKNSDLLATTLTNEVGKPLQQSYNELKGAVTRITWLLENSEKYLSDEIMHTSNAIVERITYEPLGVICNISAWNYPYLVGVNVFIPALLAGNAVMYKPSEHATMTGIQIEKLLKVAGVPSNVFHLAIGAKDTGEALLELPFSGYYFTGSYKTGNYIYQKLAPKMIPVQCELGGKDPLYVADDITDIKAVAAATADGAFYNNGQSCCSVERIYVNEKVYDKYVDEFINEVRSWKIGSPNDDGIYIGPLSRREQLSVIQQQVDDAVKKGATIRTGGQERTGRGYFFEPTVLENVNHSMSVMKEESFGPVIGIMKVATDDEAVQLMQDTEYGLTASVYSNSRSRAEQILRKINAGTGYWNCCDRVSAALPWSGRKHSGFGVTLSHAGLRAFTRPKAYHLKG